MNKNYLADIENTYVIIDGSFDKILAGCKDEKQRQIVISGRDSARDAFWAAVSSNLKDNSVFVEKIHKDLKEVNSQMQKSLKNFKDIVTFVGVMEEAVRLAASLAVLAAV